RVSGPVGQGNGLIDVPRPRGVGGQGLRQVAAVLRDHRPEVIAAHTGALLQAVVGGGDHPVPGGPVGGVHDLHSALGTHGRGDDVARSINISVAGFGQGHGTSQKFKYLRVVRHRSLLLVVNYTAPSHVGCAGTSVVRGDRGCLGRVAALECGQFLLVLRLHFGTRHSNGLDTISRGPGHNLRHTVIVVQVHQGHVVVELKAGSSRLILH